MGKGYIKKRDTISYKMKMITAEYKKCNNEKLYEEYIKLESEYNEIKKITDILYYFFQNAFNIHKILEFIKNNKLNKFDTIKYFDYLYKSQFKVSKYYTKQYKNRLLEV